MEKESNIERHLLAHLSWYDFDLGRSTIFPTCLATSANFPSAQAELGRGWNSINQNQPHPGMSADVPTISRIRQRLN